MKSSKSKWFVYTVLVGLIPIASRLLIWVTSKAGTVPAFAPQDFVAFGLVLHITAINELEHVSKVDHRSGSMAMNTFSRKISDALTG